LVTSLCSPALAHAIRNVLTPFRDYEAYAGAHNVRPRGSLVQYPRGPGIIVVRYVERIGVLSLEQR
jgi:hypothetical protein